MAENPSFSESPVLPQNHQSHEPKRLSPVETTAPVHWEKDAILPADHVTWFKMEFILRPKYAVHYLVNK